MGFCRCESYSSIKLFQNCQRAYKYKYIDKIKYKKPKSKALEHGIKIHEAISKKRKTTKQTIYALAHTKDRNDNGDTQHEVGFGLDFDGTDTHIAKYDEANFFRGIIDYLEVVWEESNILNPKLKEIKIVDWKTGKSSGDKAQLECYALLISNFLNCKENITGSFVYVDLEKKSDFEIQDGILEKREKWIIDSVMEIRKEKTFLPKPGWFCGWCDFEKQCKHTIEKDILGSSGKSSIKEIINVFGEFK